MARRMYTFYLDPDLRTGLTAIKDRDGVSESEQIRRAIRAWLKSKQYTARQKGGVRKKS